MPEDCEWSERRVRKLGDKTGIEWCDATWNCLRGCTRVSEGCRFCYAESIAYRFSGVGQPYEGLAVLKNGHASWTGKIEFIEKHLNDPIKWTKPRRIFVNSMSDVFHESVYMDWFGLMMNVMRKCPQHTFQILTKRPKRMLAFVSDYYAMHEIKPLSNLWLGVSVENQAAAEERIPLLCQTPAAIRFISAEPLIGPLDLEWPKTMYPDGPPMCCSGLPNECGCMGMPTDPPLLYGLDQIIVGGESGHGARPMDPAWARSLRDQCKRWRVAFFCKQMGSVYGEHKGKDLPPDLNIREFPEVKA
jgi:protein gp37